MSDNQCDWAGTFEIEADPRDARHCRSCGDRVFYLSSRDLCDGCESE